MSEENGNGNGNGIKNIILILAAMAGMFGAFIRPLNQEIDSLKNEQEKTELNGTRYSSRELAAVQIKFAEIETQFRNLNERTQRMETAFDEKLKALDDKLQLEVKLDKK